ncbi:enoyl-CoA hydratase [Pseudooceanicola batsensis HTCC2597]|uniref:Enoyl-CoA hydratase n=1 Tax=Pseudooceanicola batsensis (strain ATCC BAA-863 / DSM 15984 / KCTC 12145 / HTCC2597) TaxID=252305 RepID=A3TTL1_PSEBH|nr:enoyl-CoA hydratase [Pseudooceanicola batsensis]EAQ04988.1 enoyl-CoA hydratase [Pseudooceanicola batsensis HTCC2597]
MSDYEQVTYGLSDGVATIKLDRPDSLNAWTGQMATEFRDAVGRAGHDPACRVIVVTGAGRGFCAGADMGGLQGIASAGAASGGEALNPTDVAFPDAPGPDPADDYPGRFGYLYACPKPVIAAINGPCAGIGLILTLYADLRFADEAATFTTAFAARGLIAEHGMAWILPRLIGEAQALDILLTARKFKGAEAARMGLVNAALPGDELMGHVDTLARSMAVRSSPRSMAVMKRQIRKSYHQTFARSLAEADDEMRASFGAPDFSEGVNSFVEKREPRFESL